jgi:hypothetical protein
VFIAKRQIRDRVQSQGERHIELPDKDCSAEIFALSIRRLLDMTP